MSLQGLHGLGAYNLGRCNLGQFIADLSCCGKLQGGLREGHGCNGELRGFAKDYGCLDCFRVLKVVGTLHGNYGKL